MKPHIKNQLYHFWYEQWNNLENNKLKNNGGKIGEKFTHNFHSRIDEIKFTRLRIGHTRLTHSHFFTGNQAPICNECHCPFTINHILCICPRFEEERLTLLENTTLSRKKLKEFLDRKNPNRNHTIIQFLKLTNLFSEI